jgi:hypothetical protein
MRFNKNLQAIGDAYRADFLASTDEKDMVQRPELWTDEKVLIQNSQKTTNIYNNNNSLLAVSRSDWRKLFVCAHATR